MDPTDVGFDEADLASVVQQAMESIVYDDHQEQQQQDQNSGDNIAPVTAADVQQNPDATIPLELNTEAHDSVVDDFEKEIQRQIEAQFEQHQQGQGQQDQHPQEHIVHHQGQNEQTETTHHGDDGDSFAKEVERQLQQQFDQDQHGSEQLAESIRQQLNFEESHQEPQQAVVDQSHQATPQEALLQQEGSVPPQPQHTEADSKQADVDYEQELQRQIMDALGESAQPQEEQQVQQSQLEDSNMDHDYEKDLERQIMDVFNATEEIQQTSHQSSVEPQPQQETLQPSPQPLKQAQTSQIQPPHEEPQQTEHVQQPQNEQTQEEFERELQNQIMQVYADVTGNHPENEEAQPQDDNEGQIEDDYERQLHEQILQTLNEPQHEQQEHQEQGDDGMDDIFKDALAELVRNVVDQADSESQAHQHLQQQLNISSADDEEIDMNQIMQNALALAVEDPNTLLQSMNITGDAQHELLDQLLSQSTSTESTKATKKKTSKAKEKKPPKEKKPRQPRKTAKKKKELPIVSQVPNFVPAGPQFTIPGVPLAQTLQHLPQSLQVQFQQQIQQQQQKLLQQQILLQQQQQQLQAQLPVQQHVQQPQQIGTPTSIVPQQAPQQPLAQSQPTQQQQPHTPAPQQQQAVPQLKTVIDASKEPRQPKPAPAFSIIDSVKKAPSLVLLSRDTSKDLANSAKQKKKASLSIAETLALSRSTMSSGKYFSKLQEEKNTEPAAKTSESKQVQTPQPTQQTTAPLTQQQAAQSQKIVSQHVQPGGSSQFQPPRPGSPLLSASQIAASSEQTQEQPQPQPQQLVQQSVAHHQPSQPQQQAAQVTTHGDVPVYTFPSDQNDENATLESALSLANQMFKKPDESTSGAQSRSSSVSTQLPVATGTQGTAILNNIGAMLPNLPSELTTLIGAAISQALSNTSSSSHDQRELQRANALKKKLIPPKDETPEQQKERIRLENRERKKRWRDANRLKNQNNDLRARLKKRAIQLYGAEDSDKKTQWIEAEFEKRKNRRIIKSANLEDLTAIITENMSKLDTSSVNQETLTRIIGQLVTSALSQGSRPSSPPPPEKDYVEEIPGLPKGSMSAFKIQTEDKSENKVSDIDISSFLSAATAALPQLPQQSEQSGDLGTLPRLSVSQEAQQFVTEQVAKVDSPQAQVNNDLQPSNVVATSSPLPVKTLPQKRTSDVLSNFTLKKAKIPLILRKKEEAPVPEALSRPVHVPEVVPTATPDATENAFVAPSVSTPSVEKSTPVNVLKPGYNAPTSNTLPKAALPRPVPFKKEPMIPMIPQTVTPSVVPSMPVTPVSTPKGEAKLQRPKFGVPKKPTFGLRKPGAFQRPPDRKKIGA